MWNELTIEEINDDLTQCQTCDGDGGWDIASDPEVYDEWVDCPDCLGTGIQE